MPAPPRLASRFSITRSAAAAAAAEPTRRRHLIRKRRRRLSDSTTDRYLMTSRHRRRLADRIQVGPRRHADRGRQRWRLVRGYMHRQASSLQSPSAQRRSHPCTAALSTTYDGQLQAISVVQASNFIVGWRGGAMVGRRTCDQEVASSIPGRARLRNDSGQVVHTQLPRR